MSKKTWFTGSAVLLTAAIVALAALSSTAATTAPPAQALVTYDLAGGPALVPDSAGAAALSRYIASMPERRYHPPLPRNAWVLIEFWPDVMDVTLSAYFLDADDSGNQRVCESVQRVLDRDQIAVQEQRKKSTTSFRLCRRVSDARAQGLI